MDGSHPIPRYVGGDLETADDAHSKSAAFVVVAVVAVVLLLLAAVVVLVASEPAGASTPEDAVDELFNAVERGDLISTFAALAPSEREALQPGLEDVAGELEQLDVLSDVSMRKIEGLDIRIDDYKLERDELTKGIVRVDVEDADVKVDAVPDDLPLGDVLVRIIERDFNGDLDDVDDADFDEEVDDFPLVTVKQNSRWYVSLSYTLAEMARDDADEDLPDFDDALEPVGTSTPEAAVERFFEAGHDGDLEEMVGLTAPDEMAALYDYAPLFLEEATDDLEADRDDGDYFDVNELELSSEGSGTTRQVSLDAFEFAWGDESSDFTYAFDGECYDTSESYYYEGDPEFDEEDYTDEYSNEVCLDELGEEDFFDPYFTDFTTALPIRLWGHGDAGVLAITVVNVGGAWYISPTRTVLDSLASGLSSLDSDEVRRYAQLFSDPYYYGYPGSLFFPIPQTEGY